MSMSTLAATADVARFVGGELIEGWGSGDWGAASWSLPVWIVTVENLDVSDSWLEVTSSFVRGDGGRVSIDVFLDFLFSTS